MRSPSRTGTLLKRQTSAVCSSPASSPSRNSGSEVGVSLSTPRPLAHGSQQLTSSYAAAKGGVLSHTRTIAIDYAKEGIRCNSISPGTIDTPIVQIAARAIDPDRVDELIESWGGMHP